jgi:hypothetical protein
VNVTRRAALATFCATIAVVGILGAPGCYSPNIAPGGFKCNIGILPPHDCPEGFVCNGTLCVRGPLVDAASEPPVDTNPSLDAPVDKPGVDAGHDAPIDRACFQPPMTCAAASGLTCDPVCQKGCGCHQKCAVVNGALACTTPFGPFGAVGDACTIASDGASDSCSPGLTCMMDGCGNRCYAYCRSDQDCPMSACNRDAGGGQKVCDVLHVSCNPVKTVPATWGCPLVNDGCYLSPTAVDVTLCDCPFGGNGGGIGAACKLPRECDAGLVCIDPTGGNNFLCHQVCSLTGANTCLLGGACRPLNLSAKYGFCN